MNLISDELMIEQRNELFKAMQSMFEEFHQREQAANLSTHTFEPSRRFNFIFYDDDDDNNEERTIPLRDIISQLTLSIVITTSPPVLPTFEDLRDSLIMGNKDLNTIPEKESDEFIKSSVEDLVPIPSESEDTSGSDSECDLSSCKNNCMSGNPTPSSNSEVESLSPSLIPYEDNDPLLEETDILLSYFDDSLPEYETFSFVIEEKSSGSTTTHSDYSLSNYEAFYFDEDHIEEKSSGSTTTHSDFSLPEYDSFIFDLSIDPFLPVDRSVSHHEESTDELIHIISSPEYDCFYFDTETDSGELTILFEENISKHSTKEFTNVDESSSSAEETIAELAQAEVLQDQLKVKHVVIDTHTECQAQYVKLEEERYEYMIRYSALYDNEKQHRKKIDEQEILFDKMSHQLVEMNNNVLRLQEKILEKEKKISELEECVSNKDVEIEKCLERPKDCFENLRYFEKAKDLRPSLYDEKVNGLGYTPMFLTHSDEALEIEKFKRARENKIKFAYDYANLNASYVNEKINFLDDYFQEIINLDFEKIDSLFQQISSLKPYVPTVILEKIIIDLEDEVVSLLENKKANLETIESLKSKGFESSENVISESKNKSENDCQVVEKGCDQVKNLKVIAPGMFKLNVSQSVSPISVSKTSCASENVKNKTKRKRRKRKSSKQNDKQVHNGVLRANRDFVHFLDLDTFSSVRRPKHIGVIWKKKGSSNTSNVDLSYVSHLKLNKDVKRYSRKDLSCNNSHLGETSSAYVCNDAMNVSCNSRLYDSFDENNLFIFDDESIVQICLWIIDSGCSKHMTGNHALLTNFVEKFLGTVRFGNNDFAVISGYGDVVIGSMTIKKFYYVKGLGHNLFSIGQFCDNGLEVTFRKSTCFVRTEDGVDFLTSDRSSNLYTIALNKVASNSSACLLEKASSSQSWLWHQRLSHLNFATINNLVKNNLVQGLPKMKFEKDHLCSACEQGKIHQKHHKSKMAFTSNKPHYLLHMDLCVNLQLQVQRIRTDNGMEFKNKTLAKLFDEVGITQQFSIARTPQQNGVVERRNRTLVKAARTMLTFANLPLFLWAEAIATAYFIQNCLIIHKHFDKTPYELMNKRKPNIKFFYVFGCRCYVLNDYDDVGKIKAKRDIGVFVGYSKKSAAFRIYNK
nr:integrase, catalytic region, zinc finger, CCHC-type, peptidase aspartic, catalytic [Tanacetum cinerariifolium]